MGVLDDTLELFNYERKISNEDSGEEMLRQDSDSIAQLIPGVARQVENLTTMPDLEREEFLTRQFEKVFRIEEDALYELQIDTTDIVEYMQTMKALNVCAVLALVTLVLCSLFSIFCCRCKRKRGAKNDRQETLKFKKAQLDELQRQIDRQIQVV